VAAETTSLIPAAVVVDLDRLAVAAAMPINEWVAVAA
jgi:hypothetical protein